MKIEQNGVLTNINLQRNQQVSERPDAAAQDKAHGHSARGGVDRVELSGRQR